MRERGFESGEEVRRFDEFVEEVVVRGRVGEEGIAGADGEGEGGEEGVDEGGEVRVVG